MCKKCVICDSSDFQINSDKYCSQKCIHKYGLIVASNNKVTCSICDEEIIKSKLKIHLRKHEIKNYHYFCEYCNKETFEKFGSGRFCSKECAKGFSTRNKRIEINKKVSNKLSKPLKETKCVICDNIFMVKNYIKKTCSKKCNSKLRTLNSLNSTHIIKDTSKMGGLRPGGGRSHQLPYTNWLGYTMSLNKEEIKVAEELDKLKLNWNRNKKGFSYINLNGIERKYHPDFIVDKDVYIEYKGWITDEMEHKMENAKIKNNLNLIIVVGNDKRYINKGIKIDEIKNFFK